MRKVPRLYIKCKPALLSSCVLITNVYAVALYFKQYFGRLEKEEFGMTKAMDF